MYKHNIKRFIAIALLISLSFNVSSPLVAQSTTSQTTKKITSDSYNTLDIIRKQLAVILNDYFTNLIDSNRPKPSASYLDLYASQIKEVRTNLTILLDENLNLQDRGNVEILINVAASQNYIIDKARQLLSSTDPDEQYVLFTSILYISTLIQQTLSYYQSS